MKKRIFFVLCIAVSFVLDAAKKGESKLSVASLAGATRKSFFCQLLQSVEKNDKNAVKQILKICHSVLNENDISSAFWEALNKDKKKDLKLEIAHIFLKNQNVKGKLSGEVLDKAVAKSIRRCTKNLLLTILRDKLLRSKLYVKARTREAFKRSIKHAFKYNRSYLKEILSYSDLRRKIQHFDFIPRDMLLDLLDKEDEKEVKQVLDNYAHGFSEKEVNSF